MVTTVLVTSRSGRLLSGTQPISQACLCTVFELSIGDAHYYLPVQFDKRQVTSDNLSVRSTVGGASPIPYSRPLRLGLRVPFQRS